MRSTVRLDAQIQAACAADADEAAVVRLLDTIPGIAARTAELLVAEIGTDMGRFPSAAALAAWAGLAPGNDESVGRQCCGRTRKGNVWLRAALIQAAKAAARMKHTALAARYRRIAARRRAKKATIALAHALLVIAYHMIARREPYRELGEDHLTRLEPEARARRLVHQLGRLGFEVALRPSGDGAPIISEPVLPATS